MHRVRQGILWVRIRRRAVNALALLSYVVALAGIPLPAQSVIDTSEPFPCQNHACGCRSAAECWQHCCCFTPEERLQWAIAHHVPVPECLKEDLARNAGGASDDHASANCCESPDEQRHSCCCSRCKTSHADQGDASERPRRWQSGLEALRCRGASNLWLTTGAALPFPAPVAWCPRATVVDWITPVSDVKPRLRTDPLSRPPRSVTG